MTLQSNDSGLSCVLQRSPTSNDSLAGGAGGGRGKRGGNDVLLQILLQFLLQT